MARFLHGYRGVMEFPLGMLREEEEAARLNTDDVLIDSSFWRCVASKCGVTGGGDGCRRICCLFQHVQYVGQRYLALNVPSLD